MSAIERFKYYNMIVMLLIVRYIQGERYNLSGSASYGTEGDDYRFTCQISGDILPGTVRFNKGSDSVCRVILSGCQPFSSDTRFKCGCINRSNRLLYLNITNVQSTDAGNWTCGNFFNTGTSPLVTLPVYPNHDCNLAGGLSFLCDFVVGVGSSAFILFCYNTGLITQIKIAVFVTHAVAAGILGGGTYGACINHVSVVGMICISIGCMCTVFAVTASVVIVACRICYNKVHDELDITITP